MRRLNLGPWACLLSLSLLTTFGSAKNWAQESRPLATQAANTWVKHTPLEGGPVSPRLGYEGACVWDSKHQLLVRYGGHNQGGGGEQGAEVWTYDPHTAVWKLLEPNTSPPGVCCNAQNVYCPPRERYIRFPLFSGSHGWQWSRELYLNDSSVWTYDLARNTWRNMRPLPTPRLAPYRAAAWDSDQNVVVVFGGEGSHEGTLIYDPLRNEWRWPKPPREPAERSGGSMAYDAARKLHILFGSQFTDDPHTWAYDVAKNEWRDMQPPSQPTTNKNDAVLTYDPLHQKVIGIVKVSQGEGEETKSELQTWTYDAGANQWQRMNPAEEPQSSGNRARNLIFAPELNLAILENCTSRPREQQVWTYRYAESAEIVKRPSPAAHSPLVEDVVVSVRGPKRVEVTWNSPADPAVTGYVVERAAVEVYSDDQLTRLKSRTPPLAEPVVGAFRGIGPFKQVMKGPQLARSHMFVDEGLNLDSPAAIEGEPTYSRNFGDDHLDKDGRPYRRGVYVYRIRSVMKDGSLSGPSPATFTIPSSPQQVYSREDGTTCQLKWVANPEQAISGYRVYRMDGRFDKEPVSRLTESPIAETTFADATAGKSSRRYYIVAVDALGQEGLPSSPVWFQREWRQFYLPFIGEWHQ